ncbi:hypothetical protein AAHZ94_07920 [Streptomyces sp. HSW2009]|uniref:hypothetical protein n=1 Tax=Streptomyces sp. HSW2009 TaxID=3142890 RepID=UPI0032EC325E
MLTGEHAVRAVCGVVLRFFLTRAWRDEPTCEWADATDIEFQLAYEEALFDRDARGATVLRPNPRRVQLALDAFAGPGSFFWCDGGDGAGVMTTNGKAPDDCGLTPAAVRTSLAGGAS